MKSSISMDIFTGIVLAFYFLVSLIFLTANLPGEAGIFFFLDVLLLLIVIDLKGGQIKCQKKKHQKKKKSL